LRYWAAGGPAVAPGADALLAHAAATPAPGEPGGNHSKPGDNKKKKRNEDREGEKANAAWDFMELLFSIGDNKAADTKMEQLKLRTADPLHADFENQMAPLFDEFAQFGGSGPLHVTSAAFLTEGPPKQAADTVSGATAVLITASAHQPRVGRGNSFWIDVVDGGDGKLLIADLGVAGT
jgi:hypothetical protein